MGYGNKRKRNNSSKDEDDYVKKSGCKKGLDKNGKPYVQGWKVDKTCGLRKFYASPYKNTQEVKAKQSGKVWQNWFVQITLPTGQVINTSGMYEVATGRVFIKDLSFVMNPNARNRGYVGPYYYRKDS